MDQYILKQQDEDKVTFQLQFPETGTYVFELYGKPEGEGGSYPHVCSYIFQVNVPKENCMPFPKVLK